jgi:hypothetical protein
MALARRTVGVHHFLLDTICDWHLGSHFFLLLGD